ncbi:hypothetical protein FQR65_LT20529 [Abscondita terminalis]|nr:hypothetical protein FQR65_LT20529 [Abscondita terminalis]
MGYGNAEALSFQVARAQGPDEPDLRQRRIMRSPPGDKPVANRRCVPLAALPTTAGTGTVGLSWITSDVRLVDLVENLCGAINKAIPASHESEVTRAAMTGFKAMSPRELDKLGAGHALACAAACRSFRVQPGMCFIGPKEQGQPLELLHARRAARLYEERIGRGAWRLARNALRQQGFPQCLRRQHQAARSMIGGGRRQSGWAAAGHYAHTLARAGALDRTRQCSLLLRAGLARQTAPDAEPLSWRCPSAQDDGIVIADARAGEVMGIGAIGKFQCLRSLKPCCSLMLRTGQAMGARTARPPGGPAALSPRRDLFRMDCKVQAGINGVQLDVDARLGWQVITVREDDQPRQPAQTQSVRGQVVQLQRPPPSPAELRGVMLRVGRSASGTSLNSGAPDKRRTPAQVRFHASVFVVKAA